MSIKVEQLNHIYSPDTPFESVALSDVSFEIKTGEFIALIGHTGSGKSTLIQHLNGLLKPSSGKIWINDLEITQENISLVDVRKRVGLVFQYPEYQLFEETVEKDIAYGPIKLGLSDAEVKRRVAEGMELVGLDPAVVSERSPFDLSGGQKRRVAIAGVLAMKPEILILDEPTAGLDPKGREDILQQIKFIHEKQHSTVILVSHSMEDVSKLADRLLVMNRGTVALFGTPKEVFRHQTALREMGLGVPKIVELMTELKQRGWELPEDIITLDEAKKALLRILKKENEA